ncbi:MAG: SDR family oxidoreductase [Bacteroidia bacterium]|jgi:NAD(P)-dependent dehydrogenase (short-subunit alcohol dehydrogenase family)|nr:SDR family oxidoreductase [Bacteroidia bacterium]
MNNPFSIENKVLLITGATSGIGKSIAIECSKLGATVFISGRNELRLKETYSELSGKQHQYLVSDLSCENEVVELSEKVPELDGIVNCAGFNKVLPFHFTTRKDFKEVMEVNFFAPTDLTRLLIKNKKLKKGSSIIFISSISGVYCSFIANSIYSSSKGAVNGLVKALALDLAAKKIRVNSVNPGMINTNILSEGKISHEQLQEDIKRYPLKRYGEPEEVAYAVIYLLSDASTWITGSNILIDGGYTLL